CNKEGHIKTECPFNKHYKNNKFVKDKTESVINKSKDKALLVSSSSVSSSSVSSSPVSSMSSSPLSSSLVSCTKSSVSEDWFVDSGATIHLSNKKDWFQDYDESTGHSVAVASGQSLNACGTGNVIISTKNVFNSTGCQVYDAED
ncbi:PREDICTED: uncharacterized protein LOC105460528, partial [Wasmannia auropunctata]|uniref:uncharacterized protein LOC105460528 n=1 Tax=Wasmannia auropunctata TaxID=64793 RepID=UPI0005EDC651